MGVFRKRLGSFWEEGLTHVLWTNFLFAMPSATWLVCATRLLGLLRFAAAGQKSRKELKRWFAELDLAAQKSGLPLQGSAQNLALEYHKIRPLLGIGPALAAFGRESVTSQLIEMTGIEHVEAALAKGRGAVLMSTHIGAAGIGIAVLIRKGIKGLILRDAMFRKYEGTRHGRHYFLGAETLFVEKDASAAGDAVLLRCARFLRAGGVVTYLADTFSGERSSSQWVLGRNASLKTGIVGVARVCKAMVIPCFTVFQKGKLRVLYFEPRCLESSEDEEAFMKYFASIYEKLIVESPANLMWTEFDRNMIMNSSTAPANNNSIGSG